MFMYLVIRSDYYDGKITEKVIGVFDSENKAVDYVIRLRETNDSDDVFYHMITRELNYEMEKIK